MSVQGADTQGILLTDDELVAIAVDVGRPWPAPLPTVSADDADALSAASFRGHRSLVVRGLIDSDGSLVPALIDSCGAAPGATSFVLVYLGDRDFQQAGWGALTAHYPEESSWVIETTNPVGIHDLSRQPVEEHRAYFVGVLDAAMQAGTDVEGDARPTWLCVLSVSPNETVLAAARRGEIRIGPATLTAGRVVTLDAGAPATSPSAADILMAMHLGAVRR